MAPHHKRIDDDLEVLNEAVWLDHGRPCIAGTRLPISNLVAYLAEFDDGLQRFLTAYPWVGRERAINALKWVASEVTAANNQTGRSDAPARNSQNS